MRPLQDIRIVSLEQYGAGPFGSLHLADLGAEVIKVEDPRAGGDVGRYVPPYTQGEDSLFFETFNRGKKSISLDLGTPDGRATFEDLVRVSDAVYSNLRGDVPAKMRIRYDDLKHLNPRIVCCSLTGYGMTGPRADQPGYDYMLQGLAGWMALTGEPDGPPTKTGLSLVDYSGGFVAAISLLAGVHAARRDGAGMDCDLSLYDTAISLLTYPATWHLTAGYPPARTRHSAHPSLVPFQAFRAADGWLVVGCAKEKFWQRLTEVVDRPELAADPRFDSFATRGQHRDELLSLLVDIFATRTVAQWLESLQAAAIPCAPVQDVAQALTDPHTLARDLLVETEHPGLGTVRTVASPVRVGAQRPDYRRAPLRGEHGPALLRDLQLLGRGGTDAAPPVATRLARWAADLSLSDVPAEARRAACRHLLDGLGTALGALATGAAAPAVAVARGLGGPPEATLLGTRERLGAPAAALAAGALVHALDFDDTHAGGLVHATAATLPAALATGEQVGATGAQVLVAALVGYEVTCRVAAATPHGFHQRGVHATQAAGVIGAAAVAARLLGLDAATTAHAMGIAGSSAGGLLEFLHTGASTKQLHPGLAGHAGIVAARLAAAGATGPDSVLEGPAGLWAALSARPADSGRALRGLGETWEVTRITLKPYPACQLSHATLDAAAGLIGKVSAGEIAEVVASVHPDSAVIVCEPAADKVRPRTPYDAKFSLPWSLAALLLDGAVTVATYTPESVARPEVAALATRVRSVLSPSDRVAADAPGTVLIRLHDGRELTGAVDRSRGGPDAPLDDADLRDKVHGLAGSTPAADRLAVTVRDLADQPDLSTLMDLVAAAAGGRP